MENTPSNRCQTPRRLYKPDFPTKNYLELQQSKIPKGDNRENCYVTTNQDAFPKRGRDVVPQTIDTKMLQRTHWTPGDYQDDYISESHSEYVRHRGVDTTNPALNRNTMMRTTFTLSDGSGLNVPDNTMAVATHQQKRENYQEFMTATHFDLKNPSAPKWETTNQASFRPHTAQPSKSCQMGLRLGLGTKEAMEQMNVYPITESLDHSVYKDPGERSRREGISRNPRAQVQGKYYFLEQNKTNEWQKDHFIDSDGQQYYSTTTGDALAPKKLDDNITDPHYSQKRRIAFSKSSVAEGNLYPSEKRTTMQDAIRPHPNFKPPPPAERTAFVSHHDYRNWNGQQFRTTTQDAYGPKKAEKMDSVNNRLQQSHMKFGNDNIRELTTLYQDTFQKHPPTAERANMDAARAFHMGHHSNSKSGDDVRTEITTNQATYVKFKDAKPSDMCNALRGGSNIVPNEPRFTVTTSSTHEDFKPIPRGQKIQAIDNSLQRSHIQIKGDESPWTTTQADYFQFETYRMPGDLA